MPAVLSTNANGNSTPGVYTISVGGAASSNYTITFVDGTLTVTPPPTLPLVTLTNVQLVTNKKHQIIEIIVGFSGGLNAAEADSVGTFHLATPGKKGSYTAKNAKPIKLKSALYNANGNRVALTPKKPFKVTKPVQFLIHGTGSSGLQDSSGRLIDGNRDGQAGGDAVAILGRRGVSLDKVAHGSADARRASRPSAIDALLERGDLIGLRRPGHSSHSRAFVAR